MKASTRRDYIERMTEVLVYIQGNLDRELYLSDPRRVEQERLKPILRMPVMRRG